jgi:hypothetical protein
LDNGSAGLQISASQSAVDRVVETLASKYGIEIPTPVPGRAIPQSARGDVSLLAGYVRTAQREERIALVVEALAQRVADLESKLASARTASSPVTKGGTKK